MEVLSTTDLTINRGIKMKESLQKYIKPLKEYWISRSKKQQIIMISALILILIVGGLVTYLTTRTTLVPLYSNLTPSETGSIKESLMEEGYNLK